jgi:hypothetical protein
MQMRLLIRRFVLPSAHNAPHLQCKSDDLSKGFGQFDIVLSRPGLKVVNEVGTVRVTTAATARAHWLSAAMAANEQWTGAAPNDGRCH